MFAVPYNLPPSLCMKYEFMFFCLIVPGLDKRGKEENENVKRREEENENVEHGEAENEENEDESEEGDNEAELEFVSRQTRRSHEVALPMMHVNEGDRTVINPLYMILTFLFIVL
jgi:hypothetical protein